MRSATLEPHKHASAPPQIFGATAKRWGGVAASVMLPLSSGLAVQLLGFLCGYPSSIVLWFAGMLWIAGGAAQIGRAFFGGRWRFALLVGAAFGVSAWAVDSIGQFWLVTRVFRVEASAASAWLAGPLLPSALCLTLLSAAACARASRRRNA
jgi:hypothetical protein